jgi:hypothetical protein
VVVKQTWARTKSLIWFVFPAYIVGSALIQVFYAVGLLNPVNNLLAPITVLWLGLPVVVGITLIFGIVRKELTILTLAVIFGSTNFAAFLTPVQLIVIALVSMLYIPCISVILVLASEFGWKRSLQISLVEVAVAIGIGGIALWLKKCGGQPGRRIRFPWYLGKFPVTGGARSKKARLGLHRNGRDRDKRGFSGRGVDQDSDLSPGGGFKGLGDQGSVVIYFYGQVVTGEIQFLEPGLHKISAAFYRVDLFPAATYFDKVSRVAVLTVIGSVIGHLY